METEKRAASSGWVEVLFRKTQKRFNTLPEVVPEDYEFIGSSPVPIRELTRPFDLYIMMVTGNFPIPRPIAHGDIINVRITEPIRGLRTYMMIDPVIAETTLVGGTYRLDVEAKYPLGMLVLPQKFPSFWEAKHCA